MADGRRRAVFRESMSRAAWQLARRRPQPPASTRARRATTIRTRSNCSFALGALVAWLRGESGRRRLSARRRPARGCRRPTSLPKLASAEDVAPETWALVLRLNRFGDAATSHPGQHVPAILPMRRLFLKPARKRLWRSVEADGLPLRAGHRRQSRPARTKLRGPGRGRSLRRVPLHAGGDRSRRLSAFRRSRHRQDGHHLPGDPRGAARRCARCLPGRSAGILPVDASMTPWSA